MISYEEARRIIDGVKLSSTPVDASLIDARNHVLAESVVAAVPSPAFTNSAMDGIALKHADIKQPLTVLGTIYAGKVALEQIPAYKQNHCVRIMTGAVLPEWADTVVPVENLTATDDDGKEVITVVTPSALGANIRRQGEDMRAGDVILRAGMRMNPERIMVAAGLGAKAVKVLKSPTLYLLTTGDELREPGEILAPGQIYNSSKAFLTAAAAAAGVTNVRHFTVSDKPEEAEGLVRKILAEDGPKIIISTGAVSAGDADFIPELATSLGFAALFHKVAIRPGKPVYLATTDDAVWLGLPGNPISTCVGWYFFALPLLHVLAGVRAPNLYNFKLNNDVRKPEHLRCFFRAEVRDNRAWVPQSQGSGHFASSVNQDAFIILPEGVSHVKAETIVPGIFI